MLALIGNLNSLDVFAWTQLVQILGIGKIYNWRVSRTIRWAYILASKVRACRVMKLFGGIGYKEGEMVHAFIALPWFLRP